ncbi:unnamed protein product [Parascedosporium putredinis]|uniref:Uncharacterized protein n=1 Tax=Parascedosporium putredinis TaxID=1442378 RepID=A0A9P1GY07_9PEZI|nr:unnamed protein product [Parascedosporium putredinis]CAI7989491.1 unnamed protein product [Parascedosporium putredinis]
MPSHRYPSDIFAMANSEDRENDETSRPADAELAVVVYQAKPNDGLTTITAREAELENRLASKSEDGSGSGTKPSGPQSDLGEAAAITSSSAAKSAVLLRKAIEAQRSIEEYYAAQLRPKNKGGDEAGGVPAHTGSEADENGESGLKHVSATKPTSKKSLALDQLSQEGTPRNPPTVSNPPSSQFEHNPSPLQSFRTKASRIVDLQRYALSVHPEIDRLVKGGQVAIGFTSYPVTIHDLPPPPHTELEEIEAGHEAEQREKAEREAVQGRTPDSGERASPQVKAPKMLPIPKPNFEIRSGPQLEQGEEEDPYARPNRAARRHRVLLNRMAQEVVPIPEEDEDDTSEELSSYSSTSSSSAGTVVRRLFVNHGDTSDPSNRSAPSAPKESGQNTNGEPSSIKNGASAEESGPSAGMIGYDALNVGRGPASYLPAHLAPTFGRPLPQPPVQKSEEEEDPMNDIYD